MTRYYFHRALGRAIILDHEGVSLPDLVTAAKEAARRALEFEADGALKDSPDERWCSDSR